MSRWMLSLLALLTITSGANASLHQFILNEQLSPNEITVIGSGVFEVEDLPNASAQYLAINPMQVSVETMQGTVGFDLLRVSTAEDRINMIFQAGMVKLFMAFDIAGFPASGPLPPSWSDDDNVMEWNTNNMLLDPTGDLLNGRVDAMVSAVPEPSAFGFGAIAFGLVGCGRFARRRWFAKAE